MLIAYILILGFVHTLALNPSSYYPVLQQLDNLWQLNFTNTFGTSDIACNCSSPCLWKSGFNGFVCTAGILSSISFSIPLVGSLPSEIGILTSLTSLVLQNTNLNGNIPIEIQNINSLYLSNNRFTGNLPSLNGQTIYLDNNQLSGNIPLLPNVKQLNIYNNKFTGGLTNLENLNLQTCDLSFNSFTGFFPNLNWTALTSLNINNNSFIGPIPSGLALSNFLPGSCNLDLNYFDNCNVSPTTVNNNCVASCKPSICPGLPPVSTAICVDGQWQIVGDITIDIASIDSTILITGDLTLDNNSQLTISNGVIIVTGSTILNGELKIKTNNTLPKTIIQAGQITGQFNNIKLSLDKCYHGEGFNDGTSFTVFVVDKCSKTNKRIIVAAVISSFILLALAVVVTVLVIYKYCPGRMHIIDRADTELPNWR